MRSSRRVRLAAGALLSACVAFAFWYGSLTADARPQLAKKKITAKAAKTSPMPRLEAARVGRRTPGESEGETFGGGRFHDADEPEDALAREPKEEWMRRAESFDGDLRSLPQVDDGQLQERPEREGPEPSPRLAGDPAIDPIDATSPPASVPPAAAPAPPPGTSFDGLDFATFGNGHPPDTVGDVGPEYYIQSINTAIGIFRKSTHERVAAFGFNTFMSQGQFGNLCDTNNFGDPVILYDTFDDRWVITDFAFRVLSNGSIASPPGAFQCFAVSKTSDPVNGGWNFYSINTTTGLGDYPKFGIWPDGIYMSANMFGFPAGGAFQGTKVFAFNKAQMYAGAQVIQIVSFDLGPSDFTVLPANARLQAGTPPPGTPNYFLSTWNFLNAVTVYKFHVDWDRVPLSTFTGPDIPLAASSWPNAGVPNAPSLGGNSLDVLQIRAMMQNQYTNIGGAESLWAPHTVRRGNTAGFAAPRWYQVNVTGGTVAPAITQAATWDPDGANLMHRFMPSLAVDRAGNLALGYSTSSTTTKPALKYAGRLATDPINTFSQTEQLLVQGTGTQTGNCGGGVCTRWGDYAAMTLDVDGCTFWFTSMYYKVDGLNHQTNIGTFSYPSCTPIGQGNLQGTVRSGGSPVPGATVALGARTTTTDVNGFYTFVNLPAGTYPTASASSAGYVPQTIASIAVPEGGTAVRDFSIAPAATAGCLVDTTQQDFQAGLPTNCDLNGTPGSITLLTPELLDQQNLTVTNSGFGFNATNWAGQTFLANLTGQLTRVEIDLFCSGCTGTTPNITVSVRATDPVTQLPVGADLTTGTIGGFSSGAASYRSVTFTTPLSVTAGTRYAIVFRPVANPSAGIYAYVCSCAGTGTINSNPYPNGLRVTSANSGGAWTADATVGGRDLGFKTLMNIGFVGPGTFVSSLKDSNPAPGSTPRWGNLSWNATVPEGTTLQVQAAANDSPTGAFSFVGPDGTAATFFSNGASLAQFDGTRFLKYRVELTTTSGAVTPILHDVQICFEDLIVTSLSIDPASGTYGGTTTLTARLVGAGSGVAGKTIAFTLNGSSVGSGVTDGSGVATVSGVSLAGILAATYPDAVAASFTGGPGTGYTSSSASNSLSVARAALNVKADDKSKLLNAPNPLLSGVVTGVVAGDAIVATYSTTAVTDSPVGSFPIVPALDDPDGRLPNYDVTIVNGSLSITYAAAGACLGAPGHQVLAPLAADGTTTHKQNSTIPVKFRVCDAGGVSIGPPSVVSSFLLRQIVQGGVATDVSQAPIATNGDTTFRWDPTDRQWIFNLSTKNLAAGGTYVYAIALADGSVIPVRFTLR